VVLLANDNVAWKRAVAPTRPLDADPDDLGGALAARRELGIEAEQALIEGFLNRVGQAIDARVDERLTQHRATASWPRPPEPDRRRANTGPRLALAICSLVLGIPLTGIVASLDGDATVVMVLVVWTAIVIINVVFNRSSR
jgi:hypothetical protein